MTATASFRLDLDLSGNPLRNITWFAVPPVEMTGAIRPEYVGKLANVDYIGGLSCIPRFVSAVAPGLARLVLVGFGSA